MVKRLLEVAILKIGFAQLCVRSNQDEQILLVDVDKQLAKSQLLDSNLNNTIGVLAHRKLIQGLVPFNYICKSFRENDQVTY